MGNIFLASELSKTKSLLLALTQLRRIFHSQLIVLGIQGFLLGYYLTNVYLLCKDNLEEEKVINSKCPFCRSENFQIVCKATGKIVSCRQCYSKMDECPKCFESVEKSHKVTRFYLA